MGGVCLCYAYAYAYAYAEGYLFKGDGTENESDDSRWSTKPIKYFGVHSFFLYTCDASGDLMLVLF